MLPKENRISSSFDIRQIQRTGKRYHFPLLALTVIRNDLGHARFAFIVPKKLDKRATRRNRTKRLLREVVSMCWDEIVPGNDVIVAAKRILLVEKLTDVKDEVIQSLKKAEILKLK